jgi:hypothetical protein
MFPITPTRVELCENEQPPCQAKCQVTTELGAIKEDNSKAPEQTSEQGGKLAVGGHPALCSSSINASAWCYDVSISSPDETFLYCFTIKLTAEVPAQQQISDVRRRRPQEALGDKTLVANVPQTFSVEAL